jgi:hypothetical protein
MALFHAAWEIQIERLRREHPTVDETELQRLANGENRKRLAAEWAEPPFRLVGEAADE